MISRREFDVIAGVYGLAQAEVCAAGQCTHTHYAAPAVGPLAEQVVGPAADLRCPESMSKLLGKVAGARVVDGWAVELACSNCTRRLRPLGFDRVLHRFNVLGELVETVAVAGARPAGSSPG